MLAIVVSRADSASEHVGEHLLDLVEWDRRVDESRSDADGGGTVYRIDDAELREFDDLHLELDDAADAFDRVDDDSDRRSPDLLVFASRHAGETGPLLTAHHTGNFGPAEFGGEAGALARACPNAHRRVVEALDEHAPPDYDVGTECTHHGPSRVGAPSMFVEVGSGEEHWADPDAARAVARAILDLRDVAPDAPRESGSGARRQLVGFGGGHYAPRFERIVRETDWAVGHVAADWCLDAMGDPDPDVVRAAFAESAADYAVLESDRPDLRTAIDDLGYDVVSETWVRETTGVPLELVERVEDELGAVEGGIRFGDPAAEFASEGAGQAADFRVESLPEDLVAEARGLDGERAWDAVAGTALAFATEEGGTQVGARVALVDQPETAGGDREAIIESLADVLREKYDTVEVEAEAVVAETTAFEPEKARKLGVSEGPEFGKLSAGQPVEVEGRTIPPEAVHEERTRRFPY